MYVPVIFELDPLVSHAFVPNIGFQVYRTDHVLSCQLIELHGTISVCILVDCVVIVVYIWMLQDEALQVILQCCRGCNV